MEYDLDVDAIQLERDQVGVQFWSMILGRLFLVSVLFHTSFTRGGIDCALTELLISYLYRDVVHLVLDLALHVAGHRKSRNLALNLIGRMVVP